MLINLALSPINMLSRERLCGCSNKKAMYLTVGLVQAVGDLAKPGDHGCTWWTSGSVGKCTTDTLGKRLVPMSILIFCTALCS
jgi:hypothetical protein